MRVFKSVLVEELLCRGSIKDSDVTRLSRALASDPRISEHDAEILFALNASCPVHAPTWSGFFAAAIGDYLLQHTEPEGYLTAQKAAWLREHIAAGGRLRNSAGFELLTSVIARARWVPLSLTTFVLDEVKTAVVCGDGLLRAGCPQVTGIIRDSEVNVLRAALRAFGKGTILPVTRTEAEVLLDIHAATAGSYVPASWTVLFVQAMTNLLLGSAGFTPASRHDVMRGWAGVEEGDGDPRHHFPREDGAAVEHVLRHVRTEYRPQSSEERGLFKLERQRIEIVTNEQINADDDAWVAERFLTGRRNSSLEIAIVAHLRRECLLSDAPWTPRRGRGGKAA